MEVDRMDLTEVLWKELKVCDTRKSRCKYVGVYGSSRKRPRNNFAKAAIDGSNGICVHESEVDAKTRRREHPGVRDAEADAQRRRREDPSIRDAKAETQRRRREDLGVREAEADAQR